MQPTDDELIAQYRAGNPEAFSMLVQRHSTTLYTFAYRLSGSPTIAEDVVAETFIKFWKTLHRYKPGTFKAWIYTIARNTTTDYLRKKKIPVLSEFDTDDGGNALLDTTAESDILPLALIEKAEQKKLLERALTTLSLPEREILTLHYDQDMTFDQIGTLLSKPLNTVKSTHRRALQKLAATFTKEDF